MARIIDVTTPLEKDVLRFHRMRAKEEMSRLFEYELELLSLDGEVDLDALLGKGITVHLEKADGSTRYFNGMCSRISEGGMQGRFYTYHLSVRPWLWFLTRSKTYRIFQDLTVPDVLRQVFDEHAGVATVDVQLSGNYLPWVYCVQYGESDFDFVSRLMEHEGIYYYFKHTEDKHTLVIADSYSAHGPCYDPEREPLPYLPPRERLRPDEEHVSEWVISRKLQPGKYALASYDFEKPSVDLQVRSSMSRGHAQAEYEVFEYGGDYVDRSDGESYARIRIEEVQAKHERVQGATNARNLTPGYLFTLAQHPRTDQNTEFLVVSAEYELRAHDQEGRDEEATEYECRFTALKSQQPFRAERLTPKPIAHGLQTALVVGDGEIHTDEYGRVKVHFYWDRKGTRSADDSCWIRVSQNWGGKGWGGMFIPHVGQEVIVQFEGGDPDLPIITGRVYNAENMPPVALPAGKTYSIIRDHGGNEIKMQGEGGGQQIKMFSPTGNTTFAIGAPGSPGDGIEGVTDLFFKMTVGQDWKEKIDGKKVSLVQGDKTTMIYGSKNEMIKGYENKRVLGSKTELVAGAESKMNLISKNEVIVALTTKLQKGGKIEIDSAKTYVKSPTVKELYGAIQVKYGNHLAKKAKYKEELAGSYDRVAAAMRSEIKGARKDFVDTYKMAAKEAETEASKIRQEASDIKLKASNWEAKGTAKLKGDVSINGTVFKAKK